MTDTREPSSDLKPLNEAERALLPGDGSPVFSDREQAILDSFEYHQPTDEQRLRIEVTRRRYRALAAFVISTVRDSADRTAALRQLHEAQMTTLKAIVCEPGSLATVER